MTADDREARLRALSAARRRLAVMLTTGIIVIYFGFISLIAWNKPLLGRRLAPGLSLGILLGALVIVSCWLLTWVYVHWTRARYDPVLRRLRHEGMKGLGEPWPPA